MKIKTSITLSTEVLIAIAEQAVSQDQNRSEFIEAAVWAFLAQRQRDALNARDLAILNRQADALNAEAMDVLTYQIPL